MSSGKGGRDGAASRPLPALASYVILREWQFCMCRMVLDCSAMAVLILNDFSFLYVQSCVSKVAAIL